MTGFCLNPTQFRDCLIPSLAIAGLFLREEKQHVTVELIVEQAKGPAAAITSVSGASVTWLSTANQYIDMIAGVVAIVAGIYAILHYRKKMRDGA